MGVLGNFNTSVPFLPTFPFVPLLAVAFLPDSSGSMYLLSWLLTIELLSFVKNSSYICFTLYFIYTVEKHILQK